MLENIRFMQNYVAVTPLTSAEIKLNKLEHRERMLADRMGLLARFKQAGDSYTTMQLFELGEGSLGNRFRYLIKEGFVASKVINKKAKHLGTIYTRLK